MGQKQRKKTKRARPEPGRGQTRGGGAEALPSQRAEKADPGGGSRGSRSRVWTIALAAVAVAAAGAFAVKLLGSRGREGRRGPIVLVSIDTLRADHLPAYGYDAIQTPAIDELAKNGTVFEECYTHIPLTLPSHTSILTGLLPFEHGVRDNLGFKVPAGIPTLAEELKGAGYATGGAVSAYVLHASTGIARGFDWYDDQFQAPAPGTDLTDVRREGSETVKRALGWLEGRAKASGGKPEDEPVFLFVHLYEPHAPYTAPARFQRPGTAPYDAAIMYADDIVGDLFAGLRKLGLYDRSLIILLSDHGEGLKEHGEETHGVLLYREAMHVPLIVKLPENQHAGGRVKAPVELIDITPTIRAWAGLPPDPKLEGASLIAALDGGRFLQDRSVYGESLYGRLHFGWKELYSLTNARFSFILAPRQELYDIQKDPGEVHNLLTQDASAASNASPGREVALEYQAMRKELQRYVARAPLAAPKPVDQEQLKKLEALGYMGSSAPEPGTEAAAPDPKDRIGDLELFQQAMRLKTVAMFPMVAGTLEKVLATSPRMIDAWDQLSNAYRHLGDLDKAAGALKQSLAIAPQRTAQRLERVDLLIQLKRFDEARKELDVAASQKPDEAEVWRAFLEVAAGNPQAAREAASGAAQAVPAAVPYVEGVLLYQKGECAKAVPLLEKAFGEVGGVSSSELPYVRFYLGDALVRASRNVADEAERGRMLGEADQHLRDELALDPTNAAAVTSLCLVHALENDVPAIDKDLTQFARQNPSPGTYRLIAQLYGNMKLNDRAARWSQRARMAQARSQRTSPLR